MEELGAVARVKRRQREDDEAAAEEEMQHGWTRGGGCRRAKCGRGVGCGASARARLAGSRERAVTRAPSFGQES